MTATGSFSATTTVTPQTCSTRTTTLSIGSISRSPKVTDVPERGPLISLPATRTEPRE
jgi:hypothetical protein